MDAYKMTINNIANYIKDSAPQDAEKDGYDKRETVAFDAFEAASVLSVAFCKSKEEVLIDIIKSQCEEKN